VGGDDITSNLNNLLEMGFTHILNVTPTVFFNFDEMISDDLMILFPSFEN